MKYSKQQFTEAIIKFFNERISSCFDYPSLDFYFKCNDGEIYFKFFIQPKEWNGFAVAATSFNFIDDSGDFDDGAVSGWFIPGFGDIDFETYVKKMVKLFDDKFYITKREIVNIIENI